MECEQALAGLAIQPQVHRYASVVADELIPLPGVVSHDDAGRVVAVEPFEISGGMMRRLRKRRL